jgi:SAM-dependent methyltransferase
VNTFDPIWETIHQTHDWGKYPAEEIVRFVARTYYRRPRGDVPILDWGCGAGVVSWFLCREGFTPVGFDGSLTALKKARERLENETGTAHFFQAEATRLPLRDASFEAIIDSAAMYANTLAHFRLMLRECRRLLRPGGKLFSTGLFEVGMSGYGTGIEIEPQTYRDIESGPLAGRGLSRFFRHEEIPDLWAECGFPDIRIDRLERTDQNGLHRISYFMVEATRPSQESKRA